MGVCVRTYAWREARKQRALCARQRQVEFPLFPLLPAIMHFVRCKNIFMTEHPSRRDDDVLLCASASGCFLRLVPAGRTDGGVMHAVVSRVRSLSLGGRTDERRRPDSGTCPTDLSGYLLLFPPSL